MDAIKSNCTKMAKQQSESVPLLIIVAMQLGKMCWSFSSILQHPAGMIFAIFSPHASPPADDPLTVNEAMAGDKKPAAGGASSGTRVSTAAAVL